MDVTFGRAVALIYTRVVVGACYVDSPVVDLIHHSHMYVPLSPRSLPFDLLVVERWLHVTGGRCSRSLPFVPLHRLIVRLPVGCEYQAVGWLRSSHTVTFGYVIFVTLVDLILRLRYLVTVTVYRLCLQTRFELDRLRL